MLTLLRQNIIELIILALKSKKVLFSPRHMSFLAKYLFYVMVGGPPRSENENCNISAVIK